MQVDHLIMMNKMAGASRESAESRAKTVQLYTHWPCIFAHFYHDVQAEMRDTRMRVTYSDKHIDRDDRRQA